MRDLFRLVVLLLCLQSLAACTCNSVETVYDRFDGDSAGALSERITLAIAGDRDDNVFVEKSLSIPPPGALTSEVTASVRMNEAWVRLIVGLPLTGFSAGGVSLALEVKDGDRVLCQRELALLNRSTPVGDLYQSLATETHRLSCVIDVRSLSAPRARVWLRTWATVGGLASAEVEASGVVHEIRERHCEPRP